MSLSKHNYMPSYDFPEEILSEILKRLPVKYVLRCGAVQKSWYSLVRTPLFISIHSNHQKLTAHINPKYLLFNNLDTNILTVRLDDAQCEEYCNHALELQSKNTWFAQSNGLICVSHMFDWEHCFKSRISLWNPLVGMSKRVPTSPLSTFKFQEIKWKALAFGFLPEIDEYVVVHIVKPKSTAGPLDYDFDRYGMDNAYEEHPHTVLIGVYSLKINSWKKISQDKVFVDKISSDDSVFVNGTAFWVGSNSYDVYQLVMFFDTKTNILRQVEVPYWIVLHQRQLQSPLILPFGQSIGYFIEMDPDYDEYHSSHLKIWVLEDDKIGGFSWQKKMSVSLGENVWARVLGIRNNGEPILAKSNNLISYDPDTHEPYDFVESCEGLTPNYHCEAGSSSALVISPFVETLRLLGVD